MAERKCVIIESPWRESRGSHKNQEYLIDCLVDSINRGEAPFASHHMYTVALDDSYPPERQLGIECGYAWWPNADLIAFYVDLGWSEGMLLARDRATALDKTIEVRTIR